MGRSLVSRHYQECVKKLERKKAFENMSPEMVAFVKSEIHAAVRAASMSTALRG